MLLRIYKCRHRGFGPVGSIIRWEQGTDFSHFAIGFTSETGNSMVLDATGRYGVSEKPIERFKMVYEIIETIDVEIAYPIDDFRSWYEPLLGEQYGFLQLLGIILRAKKLGGGIVCNELVLRMLQRFTKYRDEDIDIRDLVYTEKVLRGEI